MASMAKKYKIQKKKTLKNDLLNVLFKLFVLIAVVIFAYIIIEKTDFSTGSMQITSIKKTKTEAAAPSELKWFDSFKGIENIKNKEDRKSSSGDSGFKYEGFKK